jgi:hypothetical protein
LSPHDGDQTVNIKVEEVSDVEDEDSVPMTFVEIKVEHEVSCVTFCPLLGICYSHPELPVLILVPIVAKKRTNRTEWLFDTMQNGDGSESVSC